jgi:hypothetical protein
MERGWLETVQLLGLDMMVVLVVLALGVPELWKLLVGWIHVVREALRPRARVLPTSPREVYPAQEWGPGR